MRLFASKFENEIEFGFQVNFFEYSSNETHRSTCFFFLLSFYLYLSSAIQSECRYIIRFNFCVILSFVTEKEVTEKKRRIMSHLKQGDRNLDQTALNTADRG